MRVALIQTAPAFLQPDANRLAALAAMEAEAADLYVLPELFASGYSFVGPQEVKQVAEPAAGPTLEAFADWARQHQAWVVYGFPERDGQRFYNAANLVGSEGLLGTYRKIHLFGRERLFFSPGLAAPPVFSLPIGRVGLMVCFDWYFPEIARSLALRGAEVLAHPSNLVLPNCPAGMITRALENRVFCATCDRVGHEVNGAVVHDFIGSSQVVAPDGEILVRLSAADAASAVVEFDPARARSKAVGEYNDLFADRSPALYPGLP